jgi:dTDP-4-dehydrorhamnose reductase
LSRIAVIGGNGMLGHAVCRRLSRAHAVEALVRRSGAEAAVLARRLGAVTITPGIDARDTGALRAVLTRSQPDIVINCAGLIKQKPEAQDAAAAIALNALLPHQIADIADQWGGKLIQIGTDCVFSGEKGPYTEDDKPDARDLYGLSKLLGEVTRAPHLTLRTSIIGPQLEGAEGLIGWFVSQKGGTVEGYRRAIFSGLTTTALADIIAAVIEDHPALSGLYHVASAPVSKFELLSRLQQRLPLGIEIVPSDRLAIDRSLDGSRFTAASGLAAPSWDSMLERLAAELTEQDIKAA